MIWIDVVRECLVVVLLGKGNFVGGRVVGDLDDVAGSEGEGLELAVILHLITIPGVAIRTDEVVTMVRTRIAKIEIYFLDLI